MTTRESRFWKDMFIINDKNFDVNDKIISTSTPVDFPKDNKDLAIEIYHTISTDLDDDLKKRYNTKIEQTGEKINVINGTTLFENIGDELTTFVNKHNQVYTGIYELITPDLLKTLFNFNTYVVLLRYPKTNGIMGCMLSVVYNTNVFQDDQQVYSPFALTTYLCVHKQIRGHAVCMILIRKALLAAHTDGMYCSYYLEEKPFSKTGLEVIRWMRPINVQNAIKHGFKFELPSIHEKIKRKLAYSIPKLYPNYTSTLLKTPVDTGANSASTPDVEINHVLNFIKANSNSKFAWSVNKTEWDNWCSSNVFDTIVLKYLNEIVGIVTIQKKSIYVPNIGVEAPIAFIPYHISMTTPISHSKELLKAAIIYCSSIDIDMLYAFECGDFTHNILSECKAVRAGGMYIDYYNYNSKFTKKDVCMPLL